MDDYAALAAELQSPGLAGLDDAAALDVLNGETVEVPAPAPMYESELLGLVGPEAFVAIFDHPRFSELKADIERQNHAGVGLWATAFHARGLIADADRDAVLGYVGRVGSRTITRAESVFGRAVTLPDLIHARSLDDAQD